MQGIFLALVENTSLSDTFRERHFTDEEKKALGHGLYLCKPHLPVIKSDCEGCR